MPQNILDLRSPQAFALGHPNGAANISFADLLSRMHELPEKGAVLRLYHDSPAELDEAIRLLEDRGYRPEPLASPSLDETGPSRARLWQPSPLLVEALQHAPEPGGAADLGCGSGREAVHLATLGWTVDAIDILPDALDKARDLARHNQVAINTVQLDLRHATLPQKDYSLITMLRFMHRSAVLRAIASLRPEGLLVLETFHERDGQRRSALVRSGELAELCAELHILVARDAVERNGRRYSQLIARRP